MRAFCRSLGLLYLHAQKQHDRPDGRGTDSEVALSHPHHLAIAAVRKCYASPLCGDA
jgi:cation transport regulator ChaB